MPETLRSVIELAVGSPKLVVLALGGLGTLLLFLRLERQGRPEMIVAIVVGALVIDATIYPSQNEVPSGLFRLSVLGQSLRPPDVLLSLALFARLHVRGLPSRAHAAGVAFGLFFAWYVAAMMMGLLAGYPANVALFQLRGGLYVVAGTALSAGVSPERLASPATLRRTALLTGLSAATIEILVTARAAVHFDVPVVAPGITFGVVGTDAATIYVVIGLIVLFTEAARPRRRIGVVAAAAAMLLMPFRISQRAALLGLATSLLVGVAATAGATWRARFRVRGGNMTLLVAALAVPILGAFVLSGLRQSPTVQAKPVAAFIPFSATVNEAFFDTRKQQSAKTRENLWRAGLRQWAEQPMLGTGLGRLATAQRAATRDELETSGYHNVVVDLLARSGIVGLGLWAAALGLAVRAGIVAWRRHANDLTAALSMACIAAVGGLMTKGLAESILEKYRLAALLGLLLGVTIAAGSGVRNRSREAQS